MNLCTCVNEEGVDGEVAHSETPSLICVSEEGVDGEVARSLLSYTLRCVSFAEVGRV
jgi:hypothetical protein